MGGNNLKPILTYLCCVKYIKTNACHSGMYKHLYSKNDISSINISYYRLIQIFSVTLRPMRGNFEKCILIYLFFVKFNYIPF